MTHTNTDQKTTDRNGDTLVGQILDIIDRDSNRYYVAQGIAAFIRANYIPKTELQISGNKTTEVDDVNNSARTNNSETGDAAA